MKKCLPFGLFAKGGRWAVWLVLEFWKWNMLLTWWLDLECQCFKESQSSFSQYLCTQMGNCTYLRSRMSKLFSWGYPCLQSETWWKIPEHLSAQTPRVRFKAQLHLFPRTCSFALASTTLITSITHWQSQKGAIISHENVTVKENIHPKLCRIIYIAMPSFSFMFFLNIQCLMQCCEHSLDLFFCDEHLVFVALWC